MTTTDKTTKPTSANVVAVDTAPNPHGQSGQWWLQKLVSTLLLLGTGIVLIVAMGVAQQIGWISAGGGGLTTNSDVAPQIHTCPMHPQIRQPGQGSCPICGMPLVPATASGGFDHDKLAVNIAPAARRLANIKTAKVSREPVVTTIETVGAIAIDESRMAAIPSYIDGRIEQLFADYTGVVVAKGDHLAVIYSPDLYSAQVEYLESRKARDGSRSSAIESIRNAQHKLAASSRQRLTELGMTEEQIGELEQSGDAKSRLTIYATAGGTVIDKMAMEGKYVEAGEPIYRLADLSTVWLMLELYPEDASHIRFGQRVEAELQSLPGQTFEGRVAFIDPTVNKKGRTVGVRVEFLNTDGRLRPGDYATASVFLPIGQRGEVYDADLAGRWISPMHPQIIRDQPGECPICGMDLVATSRYGYSDVSVERTSSLYVPRSAVLMAGSNSVVYVETEPGRFEIRPVTLGPILKDRVIIQSGLEEDELVATAGNFLIDSQMQLAGKPSLIDPARAIIAHSERKEPITFEQVHIEVVSGEFGEQLQTLYDTYFVIQQSLANDQKPSEEAATTIHKVSVALAESKDLPESARREIEIIANSSEHLHHLKIEAARLDAFRPISHAIVRLAAQVRGEGVTEIYSQMFCPMVKGGGGDWLQPNTELRNPYWGSRMLTCGDVVRQFPLVGQSEEDDGQHRHSSDKE
jgi:Cu(I)/Ag(I) efflux system membrane fusion protein